MKKQTGENATSSEFRALDANIGDQFKCVAQMFHVEQCGKWFERGILFEIGVVPAGKLAEGKRN
jgi:hypothetical protein